MLIQELQALFLKTKRLATAVPSELSREVHQSVSDLLEGFDPDGFADFVEENTFPNGNPSAFLAPFAARIEVKTRFSGFHNWKAYFLNGYILSVTMDDPGELFSVALFTYENEWATNKIAVHQPPDSTIDYCSKEQVIELAIVAQSL